MQHDNMRLHLTCLHPELDEKKLLVVSANQWTIIKTSPNSKKPNWCPETGRHQQGLLTYDADVRPVIQTPESRFVHALHSYTGWLLMFILVFKALSTPKTKGWCFTPSVVGRSESLRRATGWWPVWGFTESLEESSLREATSKTLRTGIQSQCYV